MLGATHYYDLLPGLSDLGLAAGHFDEVRLENVTLRIRGWMLHPHQRLDSIAVYWSGKLLGYARREYREDVAQVHRWIKHAGQSGFSFKERAQQNQLARIDLVGYCNDRPLARLSTLYREDLESIPLPPEPLTMRVSGVSGPVFRSHGLKMFTDLVDQINRHAALSDFRRMLDWGCGCGRVSAHFLLGRKQPEVFGCDIDREAIEWCASHLSPGSFQTIQPHPCTPYRDGMFDLVIGCSVFTHLGRENQTEWLKEIRRIAAPGGLFLASTLGDFALSLDSQPRRKTRIGLLKTLRRGHTLFPVLNGILDGPLDGALDGIAPAGYYKKVYQSRDYTVKEWGKYFEILSYIERGLNAHQDLVVMRRPAGF